MADWGGEYSFFQGIHESYPIDIRIDISISTNDSNETKQAGAGDIITSRS